LTVESLQNGHILVLRKTFLFGLLLICGTPAGAQSLAPGGAAGVGIATKAETAATPLARDKNNAPPLASPNGGLSAGSAAGVNVASSIDTKSSAPEGEFATAIATFVFMATGTTSSTVATTATGR